MSEALVDFDAKYVSQLIVERDGVELLREGVRKHALLGLQEHPAYRLILKALLPEGHRLVKAIGVFLEPGAAIPAHEHEETTTLWYPERSDTPLLVVANGLAEDFPILEGVVIRLNPNTRHAVPHVLDPKGRLSIAVLSVPE